MGFRVITYEFIAGLNSVAPLLLEGSEITIEQPRDEEGGKVPPLKLRGVNEHKIQGKSHQVKTMILTASGAFPAELTFKTMPPPEDFYVQGQVVFKKPSTGE